MSQNKQARLQLSRGLSHLPLHSVLYLMQRPGKRGASGPGQMIGPGRRGACGLGQIGPGKRGASGKGKTSFLHGVTLSWQASCLGALAQGSWFSVLFWGCRSRLSNRGGALHPTVLDERLSDQHAWASGIGIPRKKPRELWSSCPLHCCLSL